MIIKNPTLEQMRTLAHCPNCSTWHDDPSNAYCPACSSRFRALGLYATLSRDTGELRDGGDMACTPTKSAP